MEIFIWVEKMQQVNKKKGNTRIKFKDKKHRRRQAIGMERRVIEIRFKAQKRILKQVTGLTLPQCMDTTSEDCLE